MSSVGSDKQVFKNYFMYRGILLAYMFGSPGAGVKRQL